MNRRERRKQRKKVNRENDQVYKREAWLGGKLIEENHNQNPYSEEYSRDLAERLANILRLGRRDSLEKKDSYRYFYNLFLSHKNRIRDLILNWSGEKNENYSFLKKMLENYWDKGEL